MNDAICHSHVNDAIRHSHVHDAIRRLHAALTNPNVKTAEISHVLSETNGGIPPR